MEKERSVIPSGTVTFLFTDIEGSTKVALEHREIWNTLQERHHSILRSAIQAHNGYVFQIIGDAFCAAFHIASDAIAAALDAQQRLQAENWGQTPIKVRMGINTGSAQAGANADGSGGYTGYSTLVRTQRVMSTAYGEQILISNTSAGLLLGELPAGVTLRDMKEHRLKGLLNPEHLWQAVAPGLAQDFPALQTLNSIPNNLPIQVTSFIGRENEIAEIKNLVDHNRLVTLTGSGGVGKTRHSLQVGAELLDIFTDGEWLVEFASVSDPELVPHTVASVLNVRANEGRTLITALGDYLQGKKILLILDNCEHLVEACARLSDVLLRTCPGLKILASSREALGIAGEVTYRVSSLAMPDVRHLPPFESLVQYDSVRLFIERAQAVKSDFLVTKENSPAVAQICFRLDGIPLAIELAAVRVKGLSADQISKRLDSRFQLLTGGSRTALPRQQTLRAAIEWSYGLLSISERVLLRRLTVFIGDWTLEAAEAVCAQPDPSMSSLGSILSLPAQNQAAQTEAGQVIATAEVMDLLLRLVDKSLIVAEEEGGQARYHMLETIQHFALEKLLESNEEELMRARHLEFFLGFSEQAETKLSSPEQYIWTRQMGAEYANLQAALEWARNVGSSQPALRLAMATEQLGDVRRLLGAGTQAIPLYQEAHKWLQRAEGANKMVGARLHCKIIQTVQSLHWRIDSAQFEKLVEVASTSSVYLEAILKKSESELPNLELVRVLTTLSTFAGYIRVPVDWDLAEKYARTAVEMAEKLDSPVQLSTALSTLSDVYYFHGFWREVLRINQRRLTLSRDPGFNDVKGRVLALLDVGSGLMDLGEYTQAIPYILEAESLASQIRSVYLEKAALDFRTRSLFWLDRWEEVLSLQEKSRDMQLRYPAEQIGPSCNVISVFASIHALRGESYLALTQREEALAIMTTTSGPSEHWMPANHL